ncbi:MAG TPA: formate hydrogenlyase, partial [Burkholderiales bacterium]|nr:formate hydrogenlyase [Burkholderiales bacterium]
MYQLLKQIAITGIKTEAPPQPDETLRALAQRLQERVLATFEGALTIRHVDAGSCNGCELEINSLNNPYYNLEGLGFRFVASPRHADMLLVTGPVSRHMEVAFK